MTKADNKDKEHTKSEDSIPTVAMPSSDKVGPGTQIDHFRVDHELGRGGAGVVFLAHDSRLGRRVAIKMLPPEIVNNPEVLHRWKREARLLASLNHPNIATIHEELEENEGTSYLVLEYVEGETLRERIARDRLSVKESVLIALQIAEAISAAHDKGVIHRDLKPANIKITPKGRVKVLDFGIAKILGNQKGAALDTIVTQPGQVVGTPGYMSPEQSFGKETDHRTDIWSFGCILYEMLTAQRPFPGRETSEVLEAMLQHEPNWESLPKEVESPLRQILHKCLEKDLEKRYQSAEELRQELCAYEASISTPAAKIISLQALLGLLRRPRFVVLTIVVLFVICVVGYWLIDRNQNVQQARFELLPQISGFLEKEDYLNAFLLAKRAQRHIPYDAMLQRLWEEIVRDYSVVTSPAGADVFFCKYWSMDEDWIYLGKSPLERVKLPHGLFRFRITKQGFISRECIGGQGDTDWPSTTSLTLDLWEEGSSPEEMILAPVTTVSVATESSNPNNMVEMPAYWIDKYEVTNEKFKEFVDSGGYESQEYWKHQFISGGRVLTWKEAMAQFRDKTSRPGPSTWIGGTYPEGQAKYPVTGISWYEAAACALYFRKELPTYYHWKNVASTDHASAIIPYSNMKGDGPCPVGSSLAIGVSGLYDMAGNAREWCQNAPTDRPEHRYSMGGGWSDPGYLFVIGQYYSAWDRSAANGFRCIYSVGEVAGIPESLSEPIRIKPRRDYTNVQPVSQAEFNLFKRFYDYDPTDLNATVEQTDESSTYWVREKITFNASYGGERITVYLFLPKGAKPPYQTVIHFPGWDATKLASSENLEPRSVMKSIIMSGRAGCFPIFKGTYERRHPEGQKPILGGDWNANREWIIQMVRDLHRSVDYLETRSDINSEKLAYHGLSWGARLGSIMLAMEKRIKVCIFQAGGFHSYEKPAEIDEINFAARVNAPVLMVNGSEDSIFPLESSQLPLYRALGTASTDKKHIIYPGGHELLGLLEAQMRKDILAWLDKYLGPVD